MSAAMIHVDDVGMAYGTSGRPVLDGINLEIRQGEFVCVLGQTGCGKSTLLRLLLGAERPTTGRVLIDGREHRHPDRSRGYVPQRYSLFPDRTVLDNITFGAEVSEFGLFARFTPNFYRRRRAFRARAFDYLRRTGLRDADAWKYPHELSGGMQQRVAIAQALMTEPRILLMDEAFSALDPGTRRDMQQMIHALWQTTGMTVLFVTHNTQEALRIGSRVVVLAKETPDHGSRVVRDLEITDASRDDPAEFVRRLEDASEGKPFKVVGGSMRVKTAVVVAGVCLGLAGVVAAQERQPRPGVSTPGVKREIAAVKPLGVFPVPGNPDWQVVTKDAVWVTSSRKNIVGRLDPKTNTVVALVDTGPRPCSGLVEAFGSIWVPICGEQDKPDTKGLQRIDPKTNTVTATLPIGPALSEGGLTANADSIWMLTDMKGLLARIDPDTNRMVAEIQVPAGSSVVVLGEDKAIWAVSTTESKVVRIDPNTNLITDRVPVGPNPRFTTVGGGGIWTLNQGDGSVSRVDVKTRKLVTNIDVGVPGGGGEIAYGEGFVWVTAFDIPLTQIDPDNNKVVKQWVGAGGDSVRVGHGSVWLSNIRQENVWRVDPRQP